MELWQSKTIGKTVMAVEEDNENVNLEKAADAVTLLENFLWKCSMGYILYPWISLLESTLEASYKPQT